MPETFEYWNDLALSDNYKDRFRSEYNILLIRTRKLSNMLKKWEDGELDFTPDCPYQLLEEQCVVMALYLSILQKRAKLENILL